MSSNTNMLFATAAVGLCAAIYFLTPTKSAHVNSQREQFDQDLKDLSKIPLSLWNPQHTPVPGDENWKYNYNRS